MLHLISIVTKIFMNKITHNKDNLNLYYFMNKASVVIKSRLFFHHSKQWLDKLLTNTSVKVIVMGLGKIVSQRVPLFRSAMTSMYYSFPHYILSFFLSFRRFWKISSLFDSTWSTLLTYISEWPLSSSSRLNNSFIKLPWSQPRVKVDKIQLVSYGSFVLIVGWTLKQQIKLSKCVINYHKHVSLILWKYSL